MLTADTITADTIRSLKLDARARNDIDTYATCARAMDKSIPYDEMMNHRQRCADIVNDARKARGAVVGADFLRVALEFAIDPTNERAHMRMITAAQALRDAAANR